LEIFIILVGLVCLGLGIVTWILLNEKKKGGVPVEKLEPGNILRDIPKEEPQIEQQPASITTTEPKKKATLFSKIGLGKKKSKPQDQPIQPTPKKKSNLLSNLFKKIKPGKKNTAQILNETETSAAPKTSENSIKKLFRKISVGKKKKKISVEPIPFESIQDSSKTEKPPLEKPSLEMPETGTASIVTESAGPSVQKSTLSQEEENQLKKEIDLSTQLNELKEKCTNLDKLFNENSGALEKAQSALDNELRNRKEFNKVKDILEKELKDIKDRARNTQVELTSTQAESESSKKRIDQLEQKATKLEKEILEKENENEKLTKRLTELEKVLAQKAQDKAPPSPQSQETEQKQPSQSQSVTAEAEQSAQQTKEPEPTPAAEGPPANEEKESAPTEKTETEPTREAPQEGESTTPETPVLENQTSDKIEEPPAGTKPVAEETPVKKSPSEPIQDQAQDSSSQETNKTPSIQEDSKSQKADQTPDDVPKVSETQTSETETQTPTEQEQTPVQDTSDEETDEDTGFLKLPPDPATNLEKNTQDTESETDQPPQNQDSTQKPLENNEDDKNNQNKE